MVYCAACVRGARPSMAKKKAANVLSRSSVPKKKAGTAVSAPSTARKKVEAVPPKLTEAEQDLVWHMENGYQLETDSLGGNPVLRRLKDDLVLRPASANRNTVKALEERGLIVPGKGCDPLRVVWRLNKKS
jgi:hypothetical protein